jgi:hypothetical protein
VRGKETKGSTAGLRSTGETVTRRGATGHLVESALDSLRDRPRAGPSDPTRGTTMTYFSFAAVSTTNCSTSLKV